MNKLDNLRQETNAPSLIGIFNDCFPPIMDGVSVAVMNYAHWLHRKTGNVCVITTKSPHCQDSQPYPVYRYSSLPIPMRKPYRIGIPQVDWPFNRRMAQTPFGLLHAHCPFSSGILAKRIAQRQSIPLVATFHSKFRDDFERIIPNQSMVNYMIRRIVRFYEMADEVWIPQPAVEETLREYGYKGPVEVVDNGSDFRVEESPEQFRLLARRRLGLRANEFTFLFVGQHIWEKNIAFLLNALSTLRDIPFRMFFIGTGYAEKEIKQLVEKLGLASRIVFVGSITDRSRLKSYYAAADLFLFPSFYDNAPLVIREAAAMQTPSVLLQGSTSAEIIRHGENGFLSADNTHDFALLIRKLTDHPEQIRQVGFTASQSISRSWSDIMDEVLDRYTHIIHRYHQWK